MLDWLLKYPGADYARGKLIFLGGWSSAALVSAWVLGAALIVAFAWYRRRSTLSAGRLAVICGLQAAMLGLALLALEQPTLLVSSLASGENTIAVLLDNSASMQLREGAGTRLQQARAVLNSAAFAALARRYRVRDYIFSDGVEPVDDYQGLPAPGERTAIGSSVLQVARELHTSALGAVIVISDGADSAGALSDELLSQIGSYAVPVHTIGIGRETMPEDLELSDVDVPTQALPGTSVAARAWIRHDGPGVTRLKVYDGNHFLASRDVSLPQGSELTSVPISFTVDQTGQRELTFSLDPKPEEHELRNNSRTRMMDVAEHRANVLYVEGEPRWEYKFMRRALEQDPGVRLVSLLRTSVNGYYRQGIDSAGELAGGFPTSRATLYAYDALIIGSVPAVRFSPEQQQMIHDFVSERGGSLLMLAGPNGLGDGGWGHSPVGQILPTHLPDGESFHRVRAPVSLTARGALIPMLQLADDPAENARLWNTLPPIADYQDLGDTRLAATTLLTVTVDGRPQPLLVAAPYGRGRTMLLGTGGTWRWRMGLPHTDQRHQEFWRQLTRSLVSSVPSPFELQARTQGGQLEVRAELHDASFAPLTDAGITASLSSPQESASFVLHAVADQPGVYTAIYQPAHAGEFVIEAQAQRAGRSLGNARTSLQFQRGEAEYFSIRQNRALLTRLAEATGGRYWRADQLGELPQAIRASPAGVVQRQLLPLWDAPLLFIVLVALKSLEWLLRRRWGTI